MGIIAATVNLLFFGLLLGVETFISQQGWIPLRQESFLYLLDRNLFRIGDVIGLSLVAFAVGSILSRTGFPRRQYVIGVILFAVLLTAGMHWMWLWQQYPDSAYPAPGEASLLGWVHLPYFAGHIVWVSLGLRHAFGFRVRGFMLLGFLGGGIWVATLIGGA
ncbi:MAG: hypothetical protein Q7S62_03000 [bacterium]|nr:hypothetical protein [bacterium]